MPDPDQQARGRLGGQASATAAQARMWHRFRVFCQARDRGCGIGDAGQLAGVGITTAERYERARKLGARP